MDKVNLRKILKISEALVLDDLSTLTHQQKNTLDLFFKKVHYCSDMNVAQAVYNSSNIDIIFSELLINKTSCFPFLNNIREYNKTIPIIILTKNATKNLLIDFIPLGLTTVKEKPIEISHLIALLNNLAKVLLINNEKLVNIDCELSYDYISKTLISPNNKTKLTKKESAFFELLLSTEGKTFSKQDIEYHIWGEDIVSDSTFKSLIKRVRDKVGKKYLKNSTGIGYFLDISTKD